MQEAQAKMMTAQAKQAEVQIKAQDVAQRGQLEQAKAQMDMGKGEANPLDAKVRLMDAQTKRAEAKVKAFSTIADIQNRKKERESKERIEMMRLAQSELIHPDPKVDEIIAREMSHITTRKPGGDVPE
jgi:predicted transcriptional regulator